MSGTIRTNADLRYHFHPKTGWINDPNGLSWFGGKYHLFYQYLPHSEYPDGTPMHWGHAVTDDFLSFEEREIALAPDMPYDCGDVWSGTAIEKDGELYAFYASLDENKKQTISVARSRDGVHFEKYAGNPVIADYPADGSADFRDPAVLYTSRHCFAESPDCIIKNCKAPFGKGFSDDFVGFGCRNADAFQRENRQKRRISHSQRRSGSASFGYAYINGGEEVTIHII